MTHRSFRTWLDADEEGDPDALDPDGDTVTPATSPLGGKLPWRDAEFSPGGGRLRNPVVGRLASRWMRSQ